MIKKEDNILIIGAGSIGERHIRNLHSLGYSNLFVLRERNLPLRTVHAYQITILTSFSQVEQYFPKAAIICTPSAFHVPQAIRCAQMGMHLLVEKPLSHTAEEIEFFKNIVVEKGVYVQVGYMMHFHPLIKKLKELIKQETYGRLLSFTTYWGEYLPDWHPWEDYRTSYAAKKELGGGAALTLSHDLDLANWLANAPLQKYYSIKNDASSLEVDVEAGVDFIMKYENGVTGHVHLNFYEKPSKRYLHFVFEEGSVYFDYYQAQLHIKTKENNSTISLDNFDRNQLFIEQTVEFFNKTNNYTIQDSIRSIEESELIIEMCR